MMQPDSSAFDLAPDLEQRVVSHVVDSTFEDLPAAAVAGARRTLLWFLGTAIAGAGAPGSDAILAYATDGQGAPEATVFGTGQAAPAELAAFANACFAKANEHEDKYWLSHSRGYAMGFAIAPAAVATAERIGGVSGRRLVEAIAVAVDVQARLLQAVANEDRQLGPAGTGWNSTYLFSNYGTAVASAKLLGLSKDELVNALGLVHAQACGNFQGQMEGVLGIRMQAGFVVRNGMTAVRLARLGITGARQFLTGRFGLYRLHYPEYDLNTDAILADLGTDYRGARLGYKGYPCGVVVHPVLDVVRALRSSVDPDRVRSVHVVGAPPLYIMAEPAERKRSPRNFIEAQFSLPWVVACCLVDGNVALRHFAAPALDDPRIRSVASTVTVTMRPDAAATHVEFTLDDGRTVVSEPVTAAYGHPDNPVTDEHMVEVYREALEHAPVRMSGAAADAALSGVQSIESCSDVSKLFAGFR